MNIAAPDCIMSVKTDPQTGRVAWVSVCAWCEKENNETKRLRLWCESVGVAPSHGICERHAAEFRLEASEN